MFCAKMKNEMHTTSPGKGLTIFLPFFWGLAIYIYTQNWKLKKCKNIKCFFIDFQ
jgi:hypothetical protein